MIRVLESCLYAEDLEAASRFYEGALGLSRISMDPERHLFLRCDESVLLIFRASKTQIPDAEVPPHGAFGPGHLAFAASRPEIEVWRKRLESAGVDIIQTVDWSNGAKSIYFNDPAGNVLEFAMTKLWNLQPAKAEGLVREAQAPKR
jgi:catechol 2,3-dioxygenase-like lactoylglutathione lyase family enzyme